MLRLPPTSAKGPRFQQILEKLAGERLGVRLDR
jgi:hypothetical protein